MDRGPVYLTGGFSAELNGEGGTERTPHDHTAEPNGIQFLKQPGNRFSPNRADKQSVVSQADNNPALRLRQLRELAQRIRWSGMAYTFFSFLFSLNMDARSRVGALWLSGLLALLGLMRTLLSLKVVGGRNVERDGTMLLRVSAVQSVALGIFVTYALWCVRGQVIPECLVVVGVAGLSSGGATLFAPFLGAAHLNVWAQALPVYAWAAYALPRYGWLLAAFFAFHAVMITRVMRINCSHIREAILAQLALEAQTEDLRQARDEAERAGAAKMRFLANMSHEIRTPLNGVLGLTEVMAGLALTPEQREVLDDIGRSGEHLLLIVNDVLDMAKVSSGKLTLDMTPFDLPRLIRDTAAPAMALAEGRQLRFVLALPADLPAWVAGDPLRTRQVLSNLLSNAVKFTPSGEIGLGVEVPRPGWVLFRVSDTGIGLSVEQVDSLFQEFHQVDASPSRKFGGSGLGLAISRSLAEAMGGRLWVESRPGEGSTFFLELPLAAAATLAPGTASQTLPVALPPGLRILVAEDNPVNQKVIARLLSMAGARVQIAENGQAAFDHHRASPYDLILMDCQMPVLDGYEATALIRALPGAESHVPIIGVTANAFSEDRDRCLAAGMNGHVPKPLHLRTLLAAISKLNVSAPGPA